MLYSILKQLVASSFKVFYRKIYISGRENIPRDGPLIIAANHPMAFTEACLLACFLDRPLYFLVRGDVFKSNLGWFFRATHQIPIYRFRDGFSNMRKNAHTFDQAHDTLAEGHTILIFSEGNTQLQMRLSPLQKGTARLALGAYHSRELAQLKILPIGINYTAGQKFRSEVMIQIGEAMEVGTYYSHYKIDRHQAIIRLTEDLYNRLLPLVIHISDPADDEMALAAFQHLDQGDPWPTVDYSSKCFRERKEIANQINTMSDAEKNTLGHGVHEIEPLSASFNFKRCLWLLVSLPIAAFGYLINFLPFTLAKQIAKKYVTKIEFFTPVRIGVFTLIYLIYSGMITFLACFYFSFVGMLILPIMLLSGYLSIIWYEWWKDLHRSAAKAPPRSELWVKTEFS